MAIRIVYHTDTLMEWAKKEVEKYLPGWTIQWGRGKREFGNCWNAGRVITISKLLTEINPDEEFRNTVMHEIAHGIAGHDAGHGPEWKSVCVQIGAKPVRCHDAETVKGQYVGRCRWGHKTYRHRKTQKMVWGEIYCNTCYKRHGDYIPFVWDI